MLFFDLRVLVRKLASPFGNPTQVSTQVQLAATCDNLRVRLARALNLIVDSESQSVELENSTSELHVPSRERKACNHIVLWILVSLL